MASSSHFHTMPLPSARSQHSRNPSYPIPLTSSRPVDRSFIRFSHGSSISAGLRRPSGYVAQDSKNVPDLPPIIPLVPKLPPLIFSPSPPTTPSPSPSSPNFANHSPPVPKHERVGPYRSRHRSGRRGSTINPPVGVSSPGLTTPGLLSPGSQGQSLDGLLHSNQQASEGKSPNQKILDWLGGVRSPSSKREKTRGRIAKNHSFLQFEDVDLENEDEDASKDVGKTEKKEKQKNKNDSLMVTNSNDTPPNHRKSSAATSHISLYSSFIAFEKTDPKAAAIMRLAGQPDPDSLYPFSTPDVSFTSPVISRANAIEYSVGEARLMKQTGAKAWKRRRMERKASLASSATSASGTKSPRHATTSTSPIARSSPEPIPPVPQCPPQYQQDEKAGLPGEISAYPPEKQPFRITNPDNDDPVSSPTSPVPASSPSVTDYAHPPLSSPPAFSPGSAALFSPSIARCRSCSDGSMSTSSTSQTTTFFRSSFSNFSTPPTSAITPITQHSPSPSISSLRTSTSSPSRGICAANADCFHSRSRSRSNENDPAVEILAATSQPPKPKRIRHGPGASGDLRVQIAPPSTCSVPPAYSSLFPRAGASSSSSGRNPPPPFPPPAMPGHSDNLPSGSYFSPITPSPPCTPDTAVANESSSSSIRPNSQSETHPLPVEGMESKLEDWASLVIDQAWPEMTTSAWP